MPRLVGPAISAIPPQEAPGVAIALPGVVRRVASGLLLLARRLLLHDLEGVVYQAADRGLHVAALILKLEPRLLGRGVREVRDLQDLPLIRARDGAIPIQAPQAALLVLRRPPLVVSPDAFLCCYLDCGMPRVDVRTAPLLLGICPSNFQKVPVTMTVLFL